jgi:YgiT-type zinc finger domain-containing protein
MKCDNCGRNAHAKMGDIIIRIENREVKVSNIPAFKCDNCNEQIIHAVIIERAMIYARQYGVNDNMIDFELCERKEKKSWLTQYKGLEFCSLYKSMIT